MKATQIIQSLLSSTYDSKLKELYGNQADIGMQKERYIRAIKEYMHIFNDDDIAIFSAPGRSEICGNHTDHQHGKVLAASIDLDTIAVVSQSNHSYINLHSEGYQIQAIDLNDLSIHEDEEGTTESIIRGICARFKELGYEIGGLQIYISSNVLKGSGLSSSAAFEVLLGTVLSSVFNQNKVTAVEIAQIGQYAENTYFMKPCGLMDQMASSVGGFVYIDFKDPTQPIVEKIAFDFDRCGYALCIVDTKGDHVDLTHEYAAIPYEMKLIAKHYHKDVLMEVDEAQILQDIVKLRALYGDRPLLRALHFMEENKRVIDQVKALKDKNIDCFLKLVAESGNSSFKLLQNIYSHTHVQEQNISVALAVSELFLKGRGVCRIHGGGFAGTIQAFLPIQMIHEYQTYMNAIFGKNSCYLLRIRKDGGIKVL